MMTRAFAVLLSATLLGACQPGVGGHSAPYGADGYRQAAIDYLVNEVGIPRDDIRVEFVDVPRERDDRRRFGQGPGRVWTRVAPCDYQGYVVVEMYQPGAAPYAYARDGCEIPGL
jgi:hypothetical protein